MGDASTTYPANDQEIYHGANIWMFKSTCLNMYYNTTRDLEVNSCVVTLCTCPDIILRHIMPFFFCLMFLQTYVSTIVRMCCL